MRSPSYINREAKFERLIFSYLRKKKGLPEESCWAFLHFLGWLMHRGHDYSAYMEKVRFS